MKGGRASAIFVALAVLAGAAAAGSEDGGQKPEAKLVIKFKAKKMVLGPDLKSATLTGGVKATVGEVSIGCKKLELSYGSGKKIASFEAEGDVTLTMGDLVASSQRLLYDAGERTALLEGGCKVKTKSVNLDGEAISIELDTGRISIEQASGTIDIGNQTF